MPVQNFAHFGICVADPERSIHIYRDLLGFRPLSKLVVSDPDSSGSRISSSTPTSSSPTECGSS